MIGMLMMQLMIWMGEIFKVGVFLLPRLALENLEAWDMIDMREKRLDDLMKIIAKKKRNDVVIFNVEYVYVERNVDLIIVHDLDHVIVTVLDDLVLHLVDVHHHLVVVVLLRQVHVVDHLLLDDDHLNLHLVKNNVHQHVDLLNVVVLLKQQLAVVLRNEENVIRLKLVVVLLLLRNLKIIHVLLLVHVLLTIKFAPHQNLKKIVPQNKRDIAHLLPLNIARLLLQRIAILFLLIKNDLARFLQQLKQLKIQYTRNLKCQLYK